MQEHELRQQLVGEMHLRRWPLVPVPGLILQWVIMVDPADRARELAALSPYCTAPEAIADPRHLSGELVPGLHFTWERHSEGSSIALFCPSGGDEAFAAPRSHEPLADALAWIDGLPGDLVRATVIRIVEQDADAEAALALGSFSRPEMVSCLVRGEARIWSDFRLRDDGFGRLVVAVNGTDRRDFTRMLQRLQELGNYRNKALLGLPVARAVWPRLDAAEERLAALSARVSDAAETDDALMRELSDLSIELMSVSASVNYRMSATTAYARLVEERLEQLEIVPLEGFASLVDFTERRFLPAMRTCTAMVERERQLALRATQLTSLLRARINTRIENQNATLLKSMEHSSSLQLRLQQLVEGLSVVALSYYLLGLVSYLLKGTAHLLPGIDETVVVGALVIPVVGAVWLGLHAIKRRVLGEEGH